MIFIKNKYCRVDLTYNTTRMSQRRYLGYQYSQYSRDKLYINGKDNFIWFHVSLLALNAIDIGEFLISYGNNSHN